MEVDPANAEQLRAWDGDRGDFWTARAERFYEGVARYHDDFLDAAAIDATAHVLDIGCGSGQATRDAARRATAGSALGVDLSASMIELARRLAKHVPNATFRQADAQVHPFPRQHFDVAISRHGAMFFGDPPAAFANIARALRPGGRLVLLSWQPRDRNEWSTTFGDILAAGRDLPTPQRHLGALSDPGLTRELLTSAGFTDVRVHDRREPMYFGRDVADACEFISGQFSGMLADLDAASRTRVLDELRANMAEHQRDGGVYYDSASWLIEARRR